MRLDRERERRLTRSSVAVANGKHDLAYFIAVGNQRYHFAVRAAISSLRTAGEFSGDIVLISDRMLNLPGVKTVVINQNDLPDQPKRLKLRIHDFVNLQDYRRVLFLDADVVTRSPFLNKIEADVDRGAFICTDDFGQTVDQGYNRRLLTEHEIANHQGKTLGVNSGFFATNGDRLGDWLNIWTELIDQGANRPGGGYDQPALNAAMLRGLLPVQLFRGLMWFPRFDPERRKCNEYAPFAHFHGAGRKWLRGWRMHRFVKHLQKT